LTSSPSPPSLSIYSFFLHIIIQTFCIWSLPLTPEEGDLEGEVAGSPEDTGTIKTIIFKFRFCIGDAWEGAGATAACVLGDPEWPDRFNDLKKLSRN